jgi:hypothetical protein
LINAILRTGRRNRRRRTNNENSQATDVTETLDQALTITGVDQVRVKHRPRLLSDNGPAYLSGELREYLGERKMAHTRGAPYHPQTQGKIERYHRTMKNVVKLQHYYFPWELEAALRDFVVYYNNERYHEAIENVTPADVYFGRQYAVLSERSKIKRRTMERRRKEYLAQKAAWAETQNCLLAKSGACPKYFDDLHSFVRAGTYAMPEGAAPHVIILTDARCNFGDSPTTLSAS